MQKLDQIVGPVSDLGQIYKLLSIGQKQEILSHTFVKFTNFISHQRKIFFQFCKKLIKEDNVDL